MIPNKIVIFITHKLASIQNAKQIVFVKDGYVVGCGNHQQLLIESQDYQQFIETENTNKLI